MKMQKTLDFEARIGIGRRRKKAKKARRTEAERDASQKHQSGLLE
jgi:hypothetical protein